MVDEPAGPGGREGSESSELFPSVQGRRGVETSGDQWVCAQPPRKARDLWLGSQGLGVL